MNMMMHGRLTQTYSKNLLISAGYSSVNYLKFALVKNQNIMPHVQVFTFLCLNYDVQGVRRLGAAAVDMCHVALGIVEAYWEYRLKPWDMAAGVLVIFVFTSYTYFHQ